MKKRNLLLFIAVLFAFSTILAACNSGKDQGKGETKDKNTGDLATEQILRLPEGGDMDSLNPQTATDAITHTTLANVMEGLYAFDDKGDMEPALAKGDPEISEDGKTWTIEIRDDAKWSNGDPVTAQDFVDGWRYGADPKTASSYVYIMYDLKNAEAASKGEVPLEDIGVKAINETTLEITWEAVYPYTKSLLGFSMFYPMNKAFADEQGKNYAKSADAQVYNGPYVVDSWKTDDNWVLKKNDQYWNKDNVTLDTVEVKVIKDANTRLQLFEAGDLDRTGVPPEQILKYANDERRAEESELVTFWLKLNQSRNEALANLNVRKAIARGYDNAGLLQILGGGGDHLIPADFIVPNGLQRDENGKDFREGVGSLMPDNTIEDAQKYWEEAKKELGIDELKVEFLNYDDDVAQKVGEYLKDQLEKNLPGLTLDFKPTPFQQMLDLQDKQDYDIAYAGWGASYPDADYFLATFTTGNPYNRMDYSNKQFDDLIKRAGEEYAKDLDAQKRFELLQEAEKIAIEEQAIAPMYQRVRVTLTNPKVDGLVLRPFGGDFRYANIRILK